MVCRNLCQRLYSKIVFGKSHYAGGKKYCRRCEIYFSYDGVFCPCCGMALRMFPRLALPPLVVPPFPPLPFSPLKLPLLPERPSPPDAVQGKVVRIGHSTAFRPRLPPFPPLPLIP